MKQTFELIWVLSVFALVSLIGYYSYNYVYNIKELQKNEKKVIKIGREISSVIEKNINDKE